MGGTWIATVGSKDRNGVRSLLQGELDAQEEALAGARNLAAGESDGLAPVTVVHDGCDFGQRIRIPGDKIRGAVELEVGMGRGSGAAGEGEGEQAVVFPDQSRGGIRGAWVAMEVTFGQVVETVFVRVGLGAGDEGIGQLGRREIERGPVGVAPGEVLGAGAAIGTGTCPPVPGQVVVGIIRRVTQDE